MAITQQTANEIFENHPTRFDKKEKAALRGTLRDKFKAMGYSDDEISEVKSSGTNLVIGDPRAEYIFTAHYDTPGRTGWMLGTAKFLGQTGANIFMILVMLLFFPALTGNVYSLIENWYLAKSANGSLSVEISFFAFELAIMVMLLIMVLSMVAKNKNNRNDNTSGVLSLLALAEKVSADSELRGKCCFVFFDNEEWGLLGSSGFASYCKKNGINLKQTKVINFDCVGCGDVLTFAAQSKTPISKSVKAAFAEAGQSPVFKRSSVIFLSDHANFKNSVMVSYTKHSLIKLLYMPKIHTSKDTECDIEQINKLTNDFYTFAKEGKI